MNQKLITQKNQTLKALIGVGLISLASLGISQKAFSQPKLRQTPTKINFAIQPQFEYVAGFSDGMARVKVGNKWGYIDKTGKLLIPAKFDIDSSYFISAPFFSRSILDKLPRNTWSAGNFSEGLAPVKVGNRWGYIDKKGKMVIPPKFACANDFSQGLAAVGITNAKGDTRGMYINKQGKTVFTHEFRCNAGRFSQGLAIVGERRIINRTGRTVTSIPNNLQIALFPIISENLIPVYNSQGVGFIDTKGKIAIPLQFSMVYPFAEGMALAMGKDRGRNFQFIDKKGKFVSLTSQPLAGTFSQGLAPFCQAERQCGFIDKSGKVVISAQFEDVSSFSEGLAPVQVGGKWGFIRRSALTQ